jgi:hypothetical protein
MGSSPFLRTNNITIVADSDGRIGLRFQPKERIELVQELINEVNEEYEEKGLLRRDSMDLFNERGCDEIMCQFIKDLDTSHKISAA